MTRSDWYKQQAEDARSRFQDHVATTTGVENMSLAPATIHWAKPGTGTYSCTYIIYRRWLFIAGDIGEAIFEWSEKISPQFLAGCDWHYFLGKCQASPHGRNFESWDNRFAELWMRDRHSEFDDSEIPEWLASIFNSGGDKDAFESAGREVYDETGDSEEAGDIASAGMVADFHFVLQYEGLQMALKQLGYGGGK